MRLRPVLLATAVLALAGGCAVPTQSIATKLPNQLQLPPSPVTTVPSGTTHPLVVYFLRDDRLEAVTDYLPVSASTDPLDAVLLALSIGPSAAQAKRGITTAFTNSPAQISLAGPISQKTGVANVEIDAAFERLLGVSLEQASAQIVYSLTGVPGGPKAVRFVSGAAMLASFIPPGDFVDRAVTREDYCEIAPVGTHCPAPRRAAPVGGSS